MENSTIAPERVFSCISRSFILEMYSTDMESDRPPLSFRIKMEYSGGKKNRTVTHSSQKCCKYKILRQLLVLQVVKIILCNYSCKFKCFPGQLYFLESHQASSCLKYLFHFYGFFPCTYITPHQTFSSVTSTSPEVFSLSFPLQVKYMQWSVSH